LINKTKVEKIFVFSDDVEWCVDNFPKMRNLFFVGNEHSGFRAATNLWLMSLCDHFVISNSSYSWWAAWLGASHDKIVIRPEKWFRANNLPDADICPAGWLAFENH
jgi:hypothetical protein